MSARPLLRLDDLLRLRACDIGIACSMVEWCDQWPADPAVRRLRSAKTRLRDMASALRRNAGSRWYTDLLGRRHRVTKAIRRQWLLDADQCHVLYRVAPSRRRRTAAEEQKLADARLFAAPDRDGRPAVKLHLLSGMVRRVIETHGWPWRVAVETVAAWAVGAGGWRPRVSRAYAARRIREACGGSRVLPKLREEARSRSRSLESCSHSRPGQA